MMMKLNITGQNSEGMGRSLAREYVTVVDGRPASPGILCGIGIRELYQLQADPCKFVWDLRKVFGDL